MYGLELSAVLDTFREINKIDNWRGISIYFSGTYYTVIKGKIPYPFAKFMLKKYSKYRHDIRVHGNSGDSIGSKKYLEKDELGNLYVNCYHIDTKEGLIYFLSELDYYYKKVIYTEELRKKLYRNQKEIIAKVNEKLLEKGNPYYTTEQWLQERFMKEVGDFEFSGEILKYVKDFDNIVNPFSGGYEMKSPKEYVDDVTLNLCSDYTNSFKMKVFNKYGQVEHNRDGRGENDFLTYTLYYDVNEKERMQIHHYISADKNENVICLYRFNTRYGEKNYYQKIDLRYDMLSNYAYPTYGEKSIITFEEKEMIIAELKKAIIQAKKITGKMIK